MKQLTRGDGLLLVDMQNDFLPGGALAVPGSDGIVPVLRQYVLLFVEHALPVFATRDWHPPNHCSFRPQGGPWPPHCLAYSPGAGFPEALQLPTHAIVISKGTDPNREAYSGFQDTLLHDRLQSCGVTRLYVGGLATDYCVLETVRDARQLGYAVYLLIDAIQAVNVRPDDGRQAEETMVLAGAVPLRVEQLVA
ncbi:MAG: Nicotinamidase [Nitrospirae bacterium]|nr:MAG: nicotine deamidase [Nitrospira sp. OLB3]MBV6471374.1 Nicotinamidase [Nitrospirota bacterium]MCK6492241.1 isochorismatase family protein [Nitrospira sp.]MCK6498283.1 isochorismatase family protein [Nitrospira sp.]MEB2339083.1 isochorismatase family protein [Nitrospirales bacterium]